jgi:hypothetical protein
MFPSVVGGDFLTIFWKKKSLFAYCLLACSDNLTKPHVGVLISLWLFLFAAQPKEFFLDGLKTV